MTKAEREEAARQFECPRSYCSARPGLPCRSRGTEYRPLGFGHPRYGRTMVHVHPERLALVPEEQA
jgi:hypothetical protein